MSGQLSRDWRRVGWTVASLVVLVPAGFYTKIYAGPGAAWVRASLGGVFYVVFWCLVASLVWPRAGTTRIALIVLAATCLIEFSQMWHPAFLEWLRSFFIGRTILGNVFDWGDFPSYFIGAGLGWVWLRGLRTIGKT